MANYLFSEFGITLYLTQMLPLSFTFEEIKINSVGNILGGFNSVEANNTGVLNPPIMKGLNKILISSIRSSLNRAPDNLPAEEIIILLIFNL